jgi:hypothetical protein
LGPVAAPMAIRPSSATNNKPAGVNAADPVIYRFDTGYNGFMVTITFDTDSTAGQIQVDVLE